MDAITTPTSTAAVTVAAVTTTAREASPPARTPLMRLAARAQAGMTLIEIMIVIAIIGIIVAVVAVNVAGSSDEAKVKLCYTEMKKIEQAYGKWSVDASEPCPSSIDELKKDAGKRASEAMKDPWGNDYVLLCGDQAPPECEGFCVRSAGKDKKIDTDDDVKSWEKPKKSSK